MTEKKMWKFNMKNLNGICNFNIALVCSFNIQTNRKLLVDAFLSGIYRMTRKENDSCYVTNSIVCHIFISQYTQYYLWADSQTRFTRFFVDRTFLFRLFAVWLIITWYTSTCHNQVLNANFLLIFSATSMVKTKKKIVWLSRQWSRS